MPLSLSLHRGLAAAVEQGFAPAAEAFSRAVLLEFRSVPLPLLTAIALEHALRQLDPGAMDGGSECWGKLEETIMSAVDEAKAAAAR
jgi:hypothetical protein